MNHSRQRCIENYIERIIFKIVSGASVRFNFPLLVSNATWVVSRMFRGYKYLAGLNNVRFRLFFSFFLYERLYLSA